MVRAKPTEPTLYQRRSRMKLRARSPLRNHHFAPTPQDDPFPTIRDAASNNYARKCSYLMNAIRPYNPFKGVSHAFLDASFFMVRKPEELTQVLRDRILDELEDLPLLSMDIELRSLTRTQQLDQPIGVLLEGPNPQVITYLLIGTYRTAVLLDIGRLKVDGEVFIPPFIQSLLSRSDLNFVGSGILHDLADFRRLGLMIDVAKLIDTQDVADYRAPRCTYGRTGIAKQSLCTFKSHTKITRDGFGEKALAHQEHEIATFESNAADWCKKNGVLERYQCYDQYVKAWCLTHRLYDWDADRDGNLLWRARIYLFFDAVVPVFYCLRVALGIRTLHTDYQWRTKDQLCTILANLIAEVNEATDRYCPKHYLPAEESGIPSSRMPRTVPHSPPLNTDSSSDEDSIQEVPEKLPVLPKKKYIPQLFPDKPKPATFMEADQLPPIVPESNLLRDGEYCYYRAKLDYLEANHYDVLYDFSKPWQGRTVLMDDSQPRAPSTSATINTPWRCHPIFDVCRRCGEDDHSVSTCVTPIVQCPYPLCQTEREHAFPTCPDFMQECTLCRFRGHSAKQCDMRVIGERVKLWEEVADVHVLGQFYNAHLQFYCYPARDELLHLTYRDLRQHEPYAWVMIFERLAIGGRLQFGIEPWPVHQKPKNHEELVAAKKEKYAAYVENFPITAGGLLTRTRARPPAFGPKNRPKLELADVHHDCILLYRKYCEALTTWSHHHPLEFQRRAHALLSPVEADRLANEDHDMLLSAERRTRSDTRLSPQPGTSAGAMRLSDRPPDPQDVPKDTLSVCLGGEAPRFPHTPMDYSGKVERPPLEDRKQKPPVNPRSVSVHHRLGTPPPRPSVKSRLGTRSTSRVSPTSIVLGSRSPLYRSSSSSYRRSPSSGYQRSPSPRPPSRTPSPRPGTSRQPPATPGHFGKRVRSPSWRPDEGRPRTRSRYHQYVAEKKRRKK